MFNKDKSKIKIKLIRLSVVNRLTAWCPFRGYTPANSLSVWLVACWFLKLISIQRLETQIESVDDWIDK